MRGPNRATPAHNGSGTIPACGGCFNSFPGGFERCGRRRVNGPCREAEGHKVSRRRRSAFATTETLEKLIAALAIIGFSRSPKTGYSAPAAMAIPITL
jgi:hypothetical protein